MSSQFTTSITYFLQEGRENLRECLRIAFDAAQNHTIEKIIIFTAAGQGVQMALADFCSKPEHSRVRLIAVTFPAGKPFTDGEGNRLKVEIAPEMKQEFQRLGIPIVRAHLPFDPITPERTGRGVLGQDLTLVENALNIFGGSMSLCVQAILMACDAGEVEPGEHVISLTSDTAILAQAAPTNDMLCQLAVREVLCKPALYNIGRGENADQMNMAIDEGEPITIDAGEPPALPAAPDISKSK